MNTVTPSPFIFTLPLKQVYYRGPVLSPPQSRIEMYNPSTWEVTCLPTALDKMKTFIPHNYTQGQSLQICPHLGTC